MAGIRTRARRVDGGWLVNGAKTFITNGVRADFYVTAVRTREEAGHGSLSFLVIERGEGVTASKLEKLGWHASDTGEIAFDDVFVPDEHLLGDEGRGFYLIMANFQWERLLMALGSVGSMRAGLERAIPRLAGRGQAVRHAVAELATTAEAGAALTHHALRRFLDGRRCGTRGHDGQARHPARVVRPPRPPAVAPRARPRARARGARLPARPDRRRDRTRS